MVIQSTIISALTWTSGGALFGYTYYLLQTNDRSPPTKEQKRKYILINAVHGLVLGILKPMYPCFHSGASVCSLTLLPLTLLLEENYLKVGIGLRTFTILFGGALGVGVSILQKAYLRN